MGDVEWAAVGVCPECGFPWTIEDDVVDAVLLDAPGRIAHAFGGRAGPRWMNDGSWSPREYLWHVIDVIRISTEHLWTLALDPDAGLMRWQQLDAMTMRHQSPKSVAVGLKILDVVAREWVHAHGQAPPDISTWHPERGWVDRLALARWTGHEAIHHELDIRRRLPGR